MKISGLLLILAITLGTNFTENKSEFTTADCPKRPSIFEEENFNGEVYRGSFSPDGNSFYFFKKVSKRKEDYRIFISNKVNGSWSEPVVLEISGAYSDLYPSISSDGKRMVFVSYRPIPKEIRKDGSSYAYLWYVEKTKSGWGKPIFMKNVNKIGYYHSWAEFGWDDKVYFKRLTPDYRDKINLFTEWNGREYMAPEIFSEVEQWREWNGFVLDGGSPGPNQDVVLLNALTFDRQSGRRGAGLWYARRVNEKWQEPVKMNADINQLGYQNFQFYSPSGDCLYFVRDFRQFLRVSMTEVLSN